MITAPFNFVPLSEKVFFPDWAEEVSHDVPFEDAQSGVIDVTITAKSPIFVRDHDDAEQFCSHDGTYYIPGSSVKGMIRSVLEVMSFGKMSQINDDTYAVRDLRNRELYMSKMKPENTFCGWLKKDEDGYVIEDCGIPGRIKHSEIDNIFNIDFASKFRQGKFANKAKDKTAKVKYEMIKSENFEHTFEFVKKDVNREIYRYDKTSKTKGTLVLTGQPSARKEPSGEKPSGKVYEFVFFESKAEIKLAKETFQNFLFAYFDDRKTEPKESPDWTYWKEKLNSGGKVPVFFQKNGKDIAHFGLSYLYKLPYTHSVKDGLPPSHNDNRLDLAQTMFGFIGKDEALKGRVQFSHFKAVENVKMLESRTAILGTPRASYYPMYVKQQEGKLFSTFMNGDFSISGWKRYPLHSGATVSSTTDTGNENVGTTFTPLKEGTVFKGKLRYHNLKKAELGALLSSLTFHKTNGCFHNIGLAKALGYGKIEIKLNVTEDITEHLKAFEVELSEQVGDWSQSEQIRELLSMATEQSNSGNSKLKYMELEQFANSKSRDKDYLRPYTELDNINTVSATSLISEADLEALRVRQAERKEQELVLQEKRKKEEQHRKEWEIVYKSTTLATIENFIAKYPETMFLKTAQEKIADIKNSLQIEILKAKVKEAEEKWKAVVNVDPKHKETALIKFIADYADSDFAKEAKKELQSLKSVVHKAVSNIEDLASVNDGKRFKSLLEALTIDDDNKEAIKNYAIKAYGKLKGRKQRNFFREAQLGRYIGSDLENEAKSQVK